MSENSDDFSNDVRFVERLKNPEDREAWEHLFQTHWKTIYDVALAAGLDETEAQDVVTVTFITAAKRLHAAQYDPARGSLRSWLTQLTRWRLIETFRNRPGAGHGNGSAGEGV